MRFGDRDNGNSGGGGGRSGHFQSHGGGGRYNRGHNGMLPDFFDRWVTLEILSNKLDNLIMLITCPLKLGR